MEERVVKDVPLEPMPTPLQSLPPSDESILDKLPLIETKQISNFAIF